jgi:hypothetical protein
MHDGGDHLRRWPEPRARREAARPLP